MLNEIEGVLIAATEPPFNKQGAKFQEIARYRQVPFIEQELVSQKQLYRLLTKIDKKLDRMSKKRRH